MKMASQGHLRAGFDAVRTAKSRSFWTMSGVVIGVASVIVIIAIGEGVKQQVGGQIKHRGKDLITVSPGQVKPSSTNDKSGLLSSISVNAPLTHKDVTTIKHTKGVAATAPLTMMTGTAKSNVASHDGGFIIGTTPDLPSLINQSVAYGSFVLDQDMGTNVAILGSKAADELFDENVPLGRSFDYHGQEFIVRGIFNSFSSTPVNQQIDFNKAIFVPYDVVSSLTKNSAPIYEILAKPSDPKNTHQVAKNIEKSLNNAHGGQSNLLVKEGNQSIAESDSILSLITRLTAGVAVISLVVAGIGIMNVMSVTVAERTREIGIRKAVGATNRQVLEQFMIESAVLCGFGGVIGVGVAYVVQISLKLATNLTPVITWQTVVVALFVSILIGVLFGTIPALKAARRDPIEALRSQ